MTRKADLADIKRLLIERRQSILDIDSLNDVASFIESNDDSFGADEVNAQLAEIENKELKAINIALSKFNNNLYGICDDCKAEITAARLSYMPHASRCIKCQSEFEKFENLDNEDHSYFTDE